MSDGNNWVVVSGAFGSLGAACVESYSKTHHVLALDLKYESSRSPSVTTVTVDLTSPEAVDAALDRIPRGDSIALLVNAVGMIWNEPILSLKGARMAVHDVATFRAVVDANLTAAFVVASRVSARMARKGGGAIVNFSSLSAAGIPGQTAYSAAKAAIEGMTRAMAAELGPAKIRVNAVAPGFIDVPSTRAALSDDKIADYIARTPIGRLGRQDEILAAIDFLATNAFVTGTVLDIDGGVRFL